MKNNQDNTKAPFLFGLLCLIPLVGIFVGIVMIFYGLLKYKNWYFTLIGLFGIIWSIIVYSSLYYYGTHNKAANKSKVIFTEGMLNKVDMSLSFYKNEYNFYPDSLSELNKVDSFPQYIDPFKLEKIRLKETKNDLLFEYKKVNDGYVLYSVGIDEKKHTSDDIYSKNSKK